MVPQWVIGISIYPIIPVGNVDLCIVLFLFITEYEYSKIFDKISIKEKFRFNFERNWISGISAKSGFWFSQALKVLNFSVESVIFVQYWV